MRIVLPSFLKFGRVYIYVEADVFSDKSNCSSRELEETIANNCKKYPFIKDHQICSNQICEIVLDKANKYISVLDERKSDINVYSYISKKQYKHLKKALNAEEGCISCFSLVILVSIYDLLCEKNVDEAKDFIIRYVNYIQEAVKKSNTDYDDVKDYLIKSYKPVMDYINSNGTKALKLPPIPKVLILDDLK